jgi:glutamate decarboxylase
VPLHRQLSDADDRPKLDPLLAVTGGLPRLRLPDLPIPPEIAARHVRSDLILDGNARLNLATFVTTWMEHEARQLMAETSEKNMIDKDEYPQTAELELRCINILADLWHAGSGGQAVGTSTTGSSEATTGSSEAAMLGGMALLWRWRERQRAAGKPTDKPNLVTGINVQVCWEKFCRYWDVEPRLAPMDGDRRHLDGEQAVKLCDENTIGVVAVLGSTFDGSYEPVAEISAALDALQSDRGVDVPMHVDAASGGFVAPFIQPDIEWDFRLPRVQSINASGHKYGLVYPGIGWALWRDAEALPEDLVFRVNYLGGDMPTFALNFSRPGSQVVAQYYNFVRLGREGYRAVQQSSQDVARHLSAGIADLGPFELLTDGSDLPVFAFKLRDDVTNYTVFEVSRGLREHGWQVPAYTLPANLEDVAVLRIVVRNGFDLDMADTLLSHLRRSIDDDLSKLPAPPPISRPQGFHH